MPNVLVIEADPSTETLYSAVLRHHGLDCTIAGDGERALAALHHNRFDAVILDLLLPKVDGFAILRELERSAPELLSRVIVCTAVHETAFHDREELRLVQATLYKPVGIHVLAAVVLQAIAGSIVAPMLPTEMIDTIAVPLLRDAS